MTQGELQEGTNVRSTACTLAQSVGLCWRCRRPTALYSLGVAPGHERYIDDEWIPAHTHALLFSVEYLAPPMVCILRELAPEYLMGSGEAPGGMCWLSHCQHCGAAQDDYWLHCEPGAAFLPVSAKAAEQIQIVDLREPLAARVGGFSEEIPFLTPTRIIG